MMSMWKGLFEFFNPCVHQYETVATLEDRPNEPSAATIVQTCRHCGRVREQTFRAPVGTLCPPHKWLTEGKVPIFDIDKNGVQSKIPYGYAVVQRCERCGEPRRVDLVSTTRKKAG